MARRGFLAEVQRQSRLAAQQRERAQRQAVQQHNAAVRRAQQAQRAQERAQAQATRAAEAERKRLEKAARDAHVAAMESEVEAKNLELAEINDDLDSLLAATLEVDDFVDLESLRVKAEHPPFDRTDLETPLRPPPPIPDPPPPVWNPPAPPSGVSGVFGKKKHAQAVAAAQAAHQQATAAWQAEVAALPARRQEAADAHARAESERQQQLEFERQRYESECQAREAEAADQNKALDSLIANLGYGTPDAIEEYVSIVLANSVYPEHFPVSHDYTFDPSTAELSLKVRIPGPDGVPAIKAYKYTKSTDEISTTALSQKACKDRYVSIVEQVALRSLHEVFEADRRGLINTIALELGTDTIDPATGRETYVPFVAVAAERDSFVEFDLAAVVPAATLELLGAAVSKNPYGLVPADTTGVRRA
jgi:restriction system protein